MKKKIIALTPGDPDGIGPEITWKVLKSKSYSADKFQILCVGAARPFVDLCAPIIEATEVDILSGNFPSRKAPFVWLLPAPRTSKYFLPGFQAGWSIETATSLVLKKAATSLVTGPISKERLQKGGYIFEGHTEFLAQLCAVPEVTMMLTNQLLRISLVTTHVGLKDVSRCLNEKNISRAVIDTAHHLRKWFGVTAPKIAVCALNPHGGEAGIFGREEIEIITPTIERLRKKLRFCTISGPLPADTLFANHINATRKHRYDAVVCMYHDQGLIPVKLLDFHNTVNVTLGLPIVRTSVDHGTGFDIAGTGKANPSSLISAIRLAEKIVEQKV